MHAIDQIDLTEPNRQSEGFDLADLWYNVLDHWKLFCAIAASFLAAALLYGVFATPVYKADALIQVQKPQGLPLGALADVASALDINGAVEGELNVVSSRRIVGAAIDKVRADIEVSVDNYFPLLGRVYAQHRHLPANTLAAPVLGLSAYAWGGERLGIAQFSVPEELYRKPFRLTIEPGDRWLLEDADGLRLANGGIGERKQFTVTTDFGVKSGVIQISDYLGRPGTVFRIVQLSPRDAYDAMSKRMTVSETTKDSSMIRVTFSGSSPTFASAFVNEVADAYMALNIEIRSRQARLSLDFLQKKLPSLKAALDASEERLNQFRAQSRTVDVQQQTEALLKRSIDLTGQRTAVELKLEATKQAFTADHPAVQGLLSQLSRLESQQSSIDKEVKALPAAQQGYLRLARDVAVNAQIYTSLLADAQQLEVAKAGTPGTVVVIDRASVPTKRSWPNLPIILAGALAAGLFIAFLAVQFLATQRNVLRDPVQIERFSHVPLYSIVPSSKLQQGLARDRAGGPKMLSVIKGDDPSIEALRSLRSTLQFAAMGKGNNVVLFTGPTQDVGKSFISTNFAYLLALSGHRVLLVDADMRRPSLHNYLPSNQADGLAEVLAGAVPVEDAIRRSVLETLDYLPAARHRPPNPAELLDRPQFAATLEQLRARYDYVIIDSPPVLPLSDSLAIAARCNLVFLVSRSNLTTERQLRAAITRLETADVQVTGLVFNGFSVARYGYGYGYGYHHDGTTV